MRRGLFCVLSLVCGALCAQQQCGPNGCPDQAAAEQKLNIMIQQNITNRHIGVPLGRFEGIGYSTTPSVSTCVPRRPMTLTADVVRRNRNGLWVRIRVWR